VLIQPVVIHFVQCEMQIAPLGANASGVHQGNLIAQAATHRQVLA
jgi:hypothetical protein